MTSDSESIAAFIARAREKHKTTERPKSKMEPYRDEILGAVKEGLPVTAISAVLQEMYGLTVSPSNLSRWIKRQPDSSKGKGVIKKPRTKEQQAAWERLKAHNPDDPLTLE